MNEKAMTYRQLTYRSLLCINWLLYWLDSTDYHLLLQSCTENSLVPLHSSEFIQMQQVQRGKGMKNNTHYNLQRQWHPTPVLLPGKSYGWRSLVGCSLWGCWGSDTTEQLHFHFSLSCIGEGNGNPLQCSCLESPRNGGAWWAAVYVVTESDMTEVT